MPETLTHRAIGTWHPVSPRKEKLIDSRGIVIAEVFQVMISGRWAYSRNGLMGIVGSREEAKRRAENA